MSLIASKLHKIGKKSFLSGDRLYINEQSFTIETADDIADIDLTELSSFKSGHYVAFQGKLNFMSNFYYSPMVIDGITFNSNEQYYQ